MTQKKLSHADVEKLLESNDFSVGQERNDFLLPQIVDFVRRDHWINTTPEYQRRLVWDFKKKSRLIESLFMNVPVPPIFLFEHDLNRYEVMDGQQRLNAIVDFYKNGYALKGLDYCVALNGYTYDKLPPRVQRGLDRRRINATVLLAGKGTDQPTMDELRRQVFDRLNTGGQKLVPQELRNCLYSGRFNAMLIELAGEPTFNDLWGVPRYRDNIRDGSVTERLAKNSLYKRMTDVEIVLRYFAFTGAKSRIRGAVRRILDQCMATNRSATTSDVQRMASDFKRDLLMAKAIFGATAFQLPVGHHEFGGHSQPFYDAVMVSLSRTTDQHARFLKTPARLRNVVRRVVTASDESRALFVGRANTASAIRDRLSRMEEAFRSI